MAKSKTVMLPGKGGEFNVGGNPWGEVRKTTAGTRKPTASEANAIKGQVKGFGSGMKASNKRSGFN